MSPSPRTLAEIRDDLKLAATDPAVPPWIATLIKGWADALAALAAEAPLRQQVAQLRDAWCLLGGGSALTPAERGQWLMAARRLDAILGAAPVRSGAAPAPTGQWARCVNCGHTEPHNGPAGDVADGCTHPMCNCGYYVESGAAPAPTGPPGEGSRD